MNLKSADFKRSTWAGQKFPNFTVADPQVLWSSLQKRYRWTRHSIALPAGKYETLLAPSAVADLLIYAYWSSARRDADEGRSVFSKPDGGNKIGQKMFERNISIYSDPAEPGLETAPFSLCAGSSSEFSQFDNGLPLQKTLWYENGVLKNLITPRFWAAQANTSAQPYIHNLVFDQPTGPSLEEMIQNTRRGLLVTCLWYIREVDPQSLLLTGLTRDGVYLIENGRVLGAVNNFRFNMSPLAMLAQASEIGQSTTTLAREFGDYFLSAKMPPLRVRDFNMSSVSDAR